MLISGSMELHSSLNSSSECLPPANEVCEGYVFTGVCQSFCSRGGACVACHARPLSLILRDTVGKWAGGTHPTGMHSCLDFFSFMKLLFNFRLAVSELVFRHSFFVCSTITALIIACTCCGNFHQVNIPTICILNYGQDYFQ